MHLQHFVAAVLALAGASDVILGLGIIVPGTKWCGPGNIAINYDDLGIERELDICCRSHDNCKEKISPQQEDYGLSNDGIFPIFSCTCESAFRNCLTSLRNGHSLTLGRIYFRTKEVCFAYGHPTVSCRENQVEMFEKRCLNYKVDETQPKRWQFYDLAFYTHVDAQSK
ncbi:phospholipase A2 large subunit [Drosophila pseudoobscura]|uniref:Phospholipase A2 n=1 Tax=Drosophila pseudoobscura pseudoobscura TaxID=46245 RepID=A0A6I8UT30_DROPS|nr:phospholipase A2 large subunit [Drosophila pseudoobscura]